MARRGNETAGQARPARTPAAVGALTTGVRPDPEADLPAAMQELAAGRLDRAIFLQHFGWRGSQEMELAKPRWSEDADALDQMTAPAEYRTRQGGFGRGRRQGMARADRGGPIRARRIASTTTRRDRFAKQPGLRDGQALLDARLCPDPPYFTRTGSALSLTRRRILFDAGGTAALDEGRDLTDLIAQETPTAGNGVEPGGAAGLVQRRPRSVGPTGRSRGRRRGDARLTAVVRRGGRAGAGAGPTAHRQPPYGIVYSGLPFNRSGMGAVVRARQGLGHGDGRRLVAWGHRGARVRLAGRGGSAGRGAPACAPASACASTAAAARSRCSGVGVSVRELSNNSFTPGRANTTMVKTPRIVPSGTDGSIGRQ